MAVTIPEGGGTSVSKECTSSIASVSSICKRNNGEILLLWQQEASTATTQLHPIEPSQLQQSS